MSIQAISAVLSLPGDLVSPAQRLVLISLANHANREGRHAYPSRATISEETGLSTRTVSEAIRYLKGMSLLTVARYPGRDPDGHYFGSFIYDIHIPGLSTAEEPTPGRSRNTPSETPSDSFHVTDEPKKKKSSRKNEELSTGHIGGVLKGMRFDG